MYLVSFIIKRITIFANIIHIHLATTYQPSNSHKPFCSFIKVLLKYDISFNIHTPVTPVWTRGGL
jgi:hypothetical protein